MELISHLMVFVPLPLTHEFALMRIQQVRGPWQGVVGKGLLAHPQRLVVVLVAKHLAVKSGVGDCSL